MTYNTSLTVLILLFAISFSRAHVNLESPKGGETFAPQTEITIKWTETQNHGDNDWDLYYTLDGGEVWQEIALDLEMASREYTWRVPIAKTSNAKIRIVQDNRSGTDYDYISNKFTISNSPGEIEEPDIITALEDFIIHPNKDLQLSNYPNPFNTHTTIQFSISRKSHVQLNVYNALGKMVFAGVNETFDKGTYEILWKNHGFPGGIYLCKLMADDQKIINKMVLRP